MLSNLFATSSETLASLLQIKRVIPIVLLTVFWCWETWRPFFGQPQGRWRHGVRNLALALVNTVLVGLSFSTVITLVAEWTYQEQFGLLPWLGWDEPWRFVLAFLFLDGWMYLWHRANHTVPLLWRFHRMHHSDRHMDVTTATRFHLGELMISSVLRLALVPLLGLEIWHLVAYDTVVQIVIHFHHADISLGRADRWLRWLVVTPDMHKVHHSDLQRETDSNFSTVLSMWDRIAFTFRFRQKPHEIVFGLEEFSAPKWETWWGMWITPFSSQKRSLVVQREEALHTSSAGRLTNVVGIGHTGASRAGETT